MWDVAGFLVEVERVEWKMTYYIVGTLGLSR